MAEGNYMRALKQRLQEAVGEVRERYGLEPFAHDNGDFERAFRLVKLGHPVERVVALYSQPVWFSINPVQILWDKDSQIGNDLESITNTSIRRNGPRIPSTAEVVIYGSESMKVEYGKRGELSAYIHPRLKQAYRKRGLLSLPAVQTASALIRSVNRQDWERAKVFYGKLLEFGSRIIFYDSSLYSRFLSEVGSIIQQRNPNYRVSWVKDERRQYVTGYEISAPKVREAEKKDEQEKKVPKPTYVNSGRRHITVPLPMSIVHHTPKRGTLIHVQRPLQPLEKRIAQIRL